MFIEYNKRRLSITTKRFNCFTNLSPPIPFDASPCKSVMLGRLVSWTEPPLGKNRGNKHQQQ